MGKRGRPTKEPSAADRAKVAELLAEKAPISDLAKMFGLSEPTFRKYFRPEILSVKNSVEKSRPARRVTDEMREKVRRYVGCKMPIAQVALALGYVDDGDLEAFREDFKQEIAVGQAVTRAKVLDKLHDQMSAGRIGATNRLEALTQITEGGDTPQAASPGYVGKKVAAQAAAQAAASSGGKFAPRAAPRLAAVGGQRITPDKLGE